MQAASPERRLDDGPTPPHSRSKMSASLPLEILPLILQQLSSANRLSTLATCSLVCQTWSQFTRPYLWRRLWFRSQDRVHKVFSVLGEHPDLCSLVKIIELRVFPFGLPAGQAEQLEENICRALNWMHNLEELTWTRTGSLSNRILPDLLTGREKLHTLEVTGNTRFFDVDLLWKGVSHRGEQGFPLPNLRHISFVLPDSAAIKALIELAKRATLKSVLIFCHHSTVFQNVHAELLSESLAHVEKLEIVGCRRLEADALRKMVSSSQNGIRMLKLEGCGVHPSQLPTLAGPLSRNLRALSLTLPRPSFCPHSEFYTHLATLVSSLDNLTDFTLYAPGGVRAGDGDGGIDDADAGDGEAGPHDDFHDTAAQQHSNSTTTTEQSSTTHLVPKMPLSFLRSLLTSRETGLPHRRLTRLRVYGIICSAQGLKLVGSDAGPDLSGSHHTQQHTGLRDLVVQLESGPVLSIIASLLPLAPTLQTLHIQSRAGSELFLLEDDVCWIARSLVNHRSPNVYGPLAQYDSSLIPPAPPRDSTNAAALAQIGFRNRVWEVDKTLTPHNSDEDPQHSCEVHVSLRRWDASEGRWPEALLVVRA